MLCTINILKNSLKNNFSNKFIYYILRCTILMLYNYITRPVKLFNNDQLLDTYILFHIFEIQITN